MATDQDGGALEPLQRYGRLRTHDADEAQAVVAEVFEPHSLNPRDRNPLDARMNAVQTNNITLGYLTYGRAARIDLPSNDTWYHVNVTLRGQSTVVRSDGSTAHTAGRASAAVLLPQHEQVIEWNADTEQLALRIPRTTLEEHLAALTNRPTSGPLDLGLRLDLTSPSGRSLLNALDFATAEWDAGGMLARDSASRRHLEYLLLSSLLLSAHGRHRTLLDEDPRTNDGLAAARKAKEYIHEHLHELPDLRDLLAVTGVSARTLQNQFREAEGCTPARYVREARLRAVRQELLHPTSDETVTDIAIRWGFYHLGRFSAAYRALFGELPSHTIGGARVKADRSS